MCDAFIVAARWLPMLAWMHHHFSPEHLQVLTISKRGSSSLRKTGYEVIRFLKCVKPTRDTAVYDFLLKKEAEGKPPCVAKIAALNKFLRIYYARVKELYR